MKHQFSLKVTLFNIILCTMCLPVLSKAESSVTSTQMKLQKLESSSGGRLGIYAINLENNNTVQYRSDERFTMGCTTKVIGVAAILKKSMIDKNLLQQKIAYTNSDLAVWSPVTEKYVTKGMTIFELGEAAIIQSDNTAMNLLIKKLGGLDAINDFARSIGDKTFRVDQMYPEEASSIPGDLRNTSTPAMMAHSLQKLAFGNVLAVYQRDLLLTWMKNCETGNARIRAGVPKEWIVADKTGTANYGITNDIAIVWPKNHAPIILAVYFSQNKIDAPHREDILASATQIVMDEFINLTK